MAEALLKGVIAAKIRTPEDILLTDVRQERLDELREKYGVGGTPDNAGAIADAGMVFLCVKPQQMDEVLRPLRQKNAEALWVSIAAGVPTARIEETLGPGARVVRVMPNTPALVQKGAAGIAPGAHAVPADLEAVREIMESVGTCVVVDEEELHAVTAISGSGPAYLFYLVEAMLKGAEKLGFDSHTARELAIQTVLGAGTLLRESGDSPEDLRAKVTSKGGTTAAAVAAFDEAGVGEGITLGLLAAEARSRELAENG